MKTATRFAEYPDNNGNGVPDAFENRKSITEILNESESVETDFRVGVCDHTKGRRAYLLCEHVLNGAPVDYNNCHNSWMFEGIVIIHICANQQHYPSTLRIACEKCCPAVHVS